MSESAATPTLSTKSSQPPPPTYAAMAKRRSSTPDPKRTSSQISPSVREKSAKRNGHSIQHNRRVKQGDDNVDEGDKKESASNDLTPPPNLKKQSSMKHFFASKVTPTKSTTSSNDEVTEHDEDEEIVFDDYVEANSEGYENESEEMQSHSDDAEEGDNPDGYTDDDNQSEGSHQNTDEEEEAEILESSDEDQYVLKSREEDGENWGQDITDIRQEIKDMANTDTENSAQEYSDDSNQYASLSDDEDEEEDEDVDTDVDRDEEESQVEEKKRNPKDGNEVKSAEEDFEVNSISDHQLQNVLDQQLAKDNKNKNNKQSINNSSKKNKGTNKTVTENQPAATTDNNSNDNEGNEIDASSVNTEKAGVNKKNNTTSTSKSSKKKKNQQSSLDKFCRSLTSNYKGTKGKTSTKSKSSSTNINGVAANKNQKQQDIILNPQPPAPTEEDDANSVNSDATTHQMTIEEANEIHAPKSTRFQLSIPIQSAEAAAMSALIVQGKKEVPNFGSLVIQGIKDCLTEIKSIDKEALIISWKESKDFTCLALDDPFPTTTSEITKYFNGYRPTSNNKNKMFRATIKMRIKHNQPLESFLSSMGEWASSVGVTFKTTILQAENPVVVGWLAYTSAFTDVARIKTLLSYASDFEWGLRLQPISETDSKTEYRKRTKALMALVDRPNLGKATKVIQSLFVTRDISKHGNIRNYCNTFPFYPIEKRVSSQSHNRTAFNTMRTRQTLHQNIIKGQFETFISGGTMGIDVAIFDHPKVKQKVSFRQIVMSIESQTERKKQLDLGLKPKFRPLFHSFDYTPNSRAVWFDNVPGPGGSGHIFSFSAGNEPEAQEMIRGIGVWCVTELGQEEKFERILSIDHWTGLEGWQWVKIESRFITVQSRLMLETMLDDENYAIIEAANELIEAEIAEEKKKKKELEQQQKKEASTNKKASKGNKFVNQLYKEAQEELTKSKSNHIPSPATQDIGARIAERKMMKMQDTQLNPDEDESIQNGLQEVESPSNNAPMDIKGQILECDDNDNLSTTSSITEQSYQGIPLENNEESNQECDGDSKDDNSIQSATASIRTFNDCTLEKIFEDNKDKSVEETSQLAQSMLNHLLKKQLLKAQQMIEAKIQQRLEKGNKMDEKEDQVLTVQGEKPGPDHDNSNKHNVTDDEGPGGSQPTGDEE